MASGGEKRPRGERGGKQARKQKERWDRTVQGLRQPAVWAESRPNYGSQLPKGPRVVESVEVEHQETRPTESEPASSSTRKREASVLSEEPTTTLEVVPSSDSAPRGVATLSQEICSELKREAFARTVSSAVSVPSTELRIALDFHGVLDVEKAGGRSTQGISSDILHRSVWSEQPTKAFRPEGRNQEFESILGSSWNFRKAAGEASYHLRPTQA